MVTHGLSPSMDPGVGRAGGAVSGGGGGGALGGAAAVPLTSRGGALGGLRSDIYSGTGGRPKSG